MVPLLGKTRLFLLATSGSFSTTSGHDPTSGVRSRMGDILSE